MGNIGFPRLERDLARHVREAALDHDAFRMPLRICELSQCRATCCHDGVFLDDEEAAVIRQLEARLEKYDVSSNSWMDRRDGRLKSATLPIAKDALALNFPDHFPKTRCVFLDDRHYCKLQIIAMEDGIDPWWWKPVSCWMHPLLFRYQENGRPILTLERSGDPGSKKFGSCTPCDMPSDGAPPAWQALRRELELLGKIGGRDLVGELAQDAD